MECPTLTETGIYQERHHILQKGMLNCLSGTASKQETFKATHDLTELAVPTPQCLPLPHLTKTPQGPPPSSNLKSRHCFAELSVSFRRTHQAQDKRKDVSRGEMVSCK